MRFGSNFWTTLGPSWGPCGIPFALQDATGTHPRRSKTLSRRSQDVPKTLKDANKAPQEWILIDFHCFFHWIFLDFYRIFNVVLICWNYSGSILEVFWNLRRLQDSLFDLHKNTKCSTRFLMVVWPPKWFQKPPKIGLTSLRKTYVFVVDF